MLFFKSAACVLLFGCLSFSTVSEGATTLKSMVSLQMDGLTRQTLDYSCGAAAISFMLRNYFGDVMSETDILADIVLRLSVGELQSRKSEGFSMLDLKGAALRLGYMAEGVMLPREAVNVLPGPIIILLRRKDINHFAVLKGVSQGRAFLADPSRGHIRVPLHTLFDEWKGEALVLGKEGFGLPVQHGLSVPHSRAIASERDTVRSLQDIQP